MRKNIPPPPPPAALNQSDPVEIINANAEEEEPASVVQPTHPEELVEDDWYVKADDADEPVDETLLEFSGECDTPHLNINVPRSNIRWAKGKLLGVGSFGSVYQGRDLESTKKVYAVKEMRFSNKTPLARVKEVESEIRILQSLQHPNIVKQVDTDFNSKTNVLHIFLEFVTGGTITQRVSKDGPLCEVTCRRYASQILAGLVYLHNSNIIHRDIKGANCLISREDTIKIADFGTAAQCGKFQSKNFKVIADVAPPPGFTQLPASAEHKALRGTCYYMAPEVVKGVGYGRRADVWSLGCTVIEMATGRPPWSESQNQISAMYRVASGEEQVEIPQSLSTEGRNFLSWCFKRDPNDRATTKYLQDHPFAQIQKGGLSRKAPPPPPKRAVEGGPLDMRTIVGGAAMPVDGTVVEDLMSPDANPVAVNRTRNKVGKGQAHALVGASNR